MLRKLFLASISACALFVGMVEPANATFLGSILSNGDNTFEDQNREAYVDVNADDRFSVGDVLLGFVRLDEKDPPVNGVGPLENRIYSIFTQQVTSITPDGSQFVIQFAPTTVAGLTLAAITGDASIAANALTAIYSGNVGIGGGGSGLIQNSPGDLNGNGTTNLFDYFEAITGGLELTLTAGFGTGPTELDDYFTARTSSPAGAALITTSVAGLANLDSSVTLVSFDAGLSILSNADAPVVTYNEARLSGNGTLHQLVIGNGAARGAAGATNADEWGEVNPDVAFSNPGGVVTDADFFVNVTVVPEPSSITLLAFGLAGLVCVSLRRRKK